MPAGSIRVDGRLDEPAWRLASPASGFRQREPHEGQPATEDTEIRVLFDATTLYVGILARDREPGRVLARILQRDKIMQPLGFDQSYQFAGDDAVAILLDPFRDRRNAVVFATNANGAEFDALISDEGGSYNADWRAIWTVRGARTSEGWSAELAIPFRSLRYPDARNGPATWGFNAYRVIRRRNEEVLWSGWQREGGGFHRVSRAGVLEGLSGLPRSGSNVEAKPYGLTGIEQDDAGDSSGRLDAGGDLKWEVRPGLVLDATLNPDFAQVESDDEQVNLTRFDLFYPEKREFFLENAGIFDFGFRGFGEPPPFLMFFSRRIGINEDEEAEVPVLGGVRLSGRAGRQTIGFLDLVTGPAFGEGHVNYGALRYKRDVGARNYVGAMLTDRRGSAASNTAFGADASVWLAPALNVQGFYARTATSGDGGDDQAFRLGADLSGDRWGFVAQHLEVGPDLDAQMGFVTRTDIRRSDLFVRHTFRPRFAGLRKLDVFFGGQHVVRMNGEPQDWSVGPFVGVEWNSGESLGLFHGRGFLRLDESFDLADRITVPIGDYDQAQTGIFFNTSRNRPLSLEANAFLQDAYEGRVDAFGGALSAAPGAHLTLRLSWQRNQAKLPGGSFTGDVWGLRASWAFSTLLTASAFVQRNTLDDEWISNLRLNLIHRPGSDIFLVVNEERQAGRVTNRAVVLKATWLVRF